MTGAIARGTARGVLGGQLETTGSLTEQQEKGEDPIAGLEASWPERVLLGLPFIS